MCIRDSLRALTQTSFVEKVVSDTTDRVEKVYTPPLTSDQAHIADSIAESLSSFATHLLDGVTGSGKTAIYIECIKRVIDTDHQVLVLVPEIGLTPQTRSRFESALGLQVPVIHSGVSDT